MAFKPRRAIPGRVLLWALNLFSAGALIFEGYNQGVMGFVNGSAGCIETVGIGSGGKVTNTTKEGGLVAVYYFGAMFGCFIGGRLGLLSLEISSPCSVVGCKLVRRTLI
jgi:hypothetical protein